MVESSETPDKRPTPETRLDADGFRCGYIALAGRPNVGKSTLLNALVGWHLSIVSPKAQTTRQRVSGILTTDEYQILFIDTPGLIEPDYALQAAMRWAADQAVEEADVVAFVADATRSDTLPDPATLESLAARSTPVIVAVNKSDTLDESAGADLVNGYRERGYTALPISATTGAGLGDLLEHLVAHLPESPPLFPPEDTAIQPVRFFAAEYVRESCVLRYHDEVPYSIACRVEEFREAQDPVYVRVDILVERESQKGIVIGHKGSAIKEVGARSREKLEALIGRRVYLDLRVKVMSKWSRKRRRLEELGFQVPAGDAKGGQEAV